MSIVVQKGNGFSGQYTQDVIATTTDWTGTAAVYSSYPGTAIFSDDLELSGDGTKLLFTLPADQILNLDAGVYSVVGNLKSTALDIDTYRIDYMTVTDTVISDQPMTKLFMTIGKRDGTPAGRSIHSLANTANGAVVRIGWEGISVTATYQVAGVPSRLPMVINNLVIGKRDGTPAGRSIHSLANTANGAVVRIGWEGISVTATYQVAETIDGIIWGIEKTDTKTNAAGYAELFVLTGSVPTVSCPAFGKSVTVDTTGLDTIDLSTFF